MNIPNMLDKAREYHLRHPDLHMDLTLETNRIHRRLSSVIPFYGHVDGGVLADALADILTSCASRGWHIGISMASLSIPVRERSYEDFVAEAHVGVSLVYGATLADEDEAPPVFFFALAFRHLLDLAAKAGIEVDPMVDARLSG